MATEGFDHCSAAHLEIPMCLVAWYEASKCWGLSTFRQISGRDRQQLNKERWWSEGRQTDARRVMSVTIALHRFGHGVQHANGNAFQWVFCQIPPLRWPQCFLRKPTNIHTILWEGGRVNLERVQERLPLSSVKKRGFCWELIKMLHGHKMLRPFNVPANQRQRSPAT